MTTLTVHRGTREIGGTCIEIVSASGERLILDAGRPLDAGQHAVRLPATLDRVVSATVVFSHAHQDHWGLIGELPAHWPLRAGERTAALMGIGADLARTPCPARSTPGTAALGRSRSARSPSPRS